MEGGEEAASASSFLDGFRQLKPDDDDDIQKRKARYFTRSGLIKAKWGTAARERALIKWGIKYQVDDTPGDGTPDGGNPSSSSGGGAPDDSTSSNSTHGGDDGGVDDDSDEESGGDGGGVGDHDHGPGGGGGGADGDGRTTTTSSVGDKRGHSGGEQGGSNKKIKGPQYYFQCMAHKECMKPDRIINITGNIGNAWSHMEAKHGVLRPSKAAAAKKTKILDEKRSQDVRRDPFQALYPKRFYVLHMVWNFIVLCLLPFTFFEKNPIRSGLKGVVKSTFDPKSLYRKSVRDTIVDFYDAAKGLWVGIFSSLMAKTPFPFINFHLDLWTAKTSGEKYMGK